jgi:multidrug resistance efflux pump
MRKAYVLGMVAVLSAIAVPVWMYSRGEAGSPGRSQTAPTAKSEAPREEATIQGIGFVEPRGELRKLVLKVNGVIARCPAEVGRRYKKGDALAELDNREQLAAVAVAESEWKLAQAERDKVLCGVNPHQIAAAEHKVESLREQVRYSSVEHERYSALASRGSASPSEYDKSATELRQRQFELQQAEADLRHLRNSVRDEDRALAEAKVVAAKTRFELAKQQHEDTILRAPSDGTVLEILKREGEGSRLFDPEPVLIFGDISRLRVRAEVDERFVAGLEVGQPAVAFGRGLGDREYPGRVVLVKPIMGKKTVFSRSATERKDLDVMQVLIDLDPGFRAPTGLQVDVKIIIASPAE